jgi:hypothetical protein
VKQLNRIIGIDNERFKRATITPFAFNYIFPRNAWTVAWWSMALPGMGHIILGHSYKGIIFFVWELFINTQAGLNTAILYSFTGDFELARQFLDYKWLLLYPPVLIFSVWDSYHIAAEQNKVFYLCTREKPVINFIAIDSLGINYLKPYNPLHMALWSAFVPGLGHVCMKRLVTGFWGLLMWISIVYLSGMNQGIHLTFAGSFQEVKSVLNPQWLLFLPSIFCYAVYSAYVNAQAINELYQVEQRDFLEQHFQPKTFVMPL